MTCPNCKSKDIDFHEAGGHSYCVSCGTVVEENAIVSSIEFQESGDRSHVVGQFVSANCSQPFSAGGHTRGRFSQDSREATLQNIKRLVAQTASQMRLPTMYSDRAYRLYQLALQKNFVFGRRQLHVVATCLYFICRQEKSPHLLIDFSDALQINVYILGKAFIQFVRTMNLPLPIVDPSLFIHRFAQMLEFGDKISAVSTTALRIVTRMNKDWMVTGRRPDGVCAAAMLISARSHGFPKGQGEIAKIFRVSAGTLQHRLEEFRATPSAQLTLEQFHRYDMPMEFDPPAFIRNQVNASREGGNIRMNIAGADGTMQSLTGDDEESDDDRDEDDLDEEGNRNEMEYEGHDDDDDDADDDGDGGEDRQALRSSSRAKATKSVAAVIGGVAIRVPLPGVKSRNTSSLVQIHKRQARQALYDDIYGEMAEAATSMMGEAGQDNAAKLLREAQEVEASEEGVGGWGTKRPRLARSDNDSSSSSSSSSSHIGKGKSGRKSAHVINAEDDDEKTTRGAVGSVGASKEAGEVGEDGAEAAGTGEAQVGSAPSDGPVPGSTFPAIDDSDLDMYLLDGDEKIKRTDLWEKSFRPYLDERDRRREARERDEAQRGENGTMTRNGKLRKKNARRDVARSTASLAVLAGAQASIRKSSKKINYDALKGVFGEDGNFAAPEPSAAQLVAMTASLTGVGVIEEGYDEEVEEYDSDVRKLRKHAAARTKVVLGSSSRATNATSPRHTSGVPLSKVPVQLPGAASSSAAGGIATRAPAGVAGVKPIVGTASASASASNTNSKTALAEKVGAAGGTAGEYEGLEDGDDDDGLMYEDAGDDYDDDGGEYY